MKKILAFTLVVLVVLSLFSLTGCSKTDGTVATADEASIATSDEAEIATRDEITFDFKTSTELYINWTTKNGTPLTGIVGLDYNETQKNVSLSMLYEDGSEIFDIDVNEDKVRLEVAIPKTEITLATEVLY